MGAEPRLGALGSLLMTLAKMTPRARLYMALCGFRHLGVGFFCLLMPDAWSSGNFRVLKTILPGVDPLDMMRLWGSIFILVGLLSAYAAISGREGAARLGLRGSVTSTALWAGGFLAAALTGTTAGLSGMIVWAALAAKDLTMLRDPLRNPFEDMDMFDRSDTRAAE